MLVLAFENTVPPRSHTPFRLIQGVDGDSGKVECEFVGVVCQKVTAVVSPRLVLEPADGWEAV